MKQPGQIALIPFPFTDLSKAKLRPVVLLCRTPGCFDDWLVCMISSQLHQAEPGFDEIIAQKDTDYATSGLKVSSVLRLSRLAVVDGAVLVGAIGSIGKERLARIRKRIADWIEGKEVVR